jgi:hypothetical protein
MADKGYAMQGAEKKQGGEQKETSCLECWLLDQKDFAANPEVCLT